MHTHEREWKQNTLVRATEKGRMAENQRLKKARSKNEEAKTRV